VGVTAGEYDWVVFDLGGVLVRLRGVSKLRLLAGYASDDDVWRRWLACDWVRSFELGRCSAQAFAEGLVRDWELPVAPEEFLDDFRTWPEALEEGAAELVAAVRATTTVACLSNSNALHWPAKVDVLGIGAMFDRCFASHQLGAIKPDHDAFERVAAELAVPPGRLLFLDDNEVNVSAARSVGFAAERVRGVVEARATLVRLGVLD
jgi:putative hydrolase of the HAD superfamily